MIARQPIVDAGHQVVGYELFDRSQAQGDHTAASDVSLVFNALSHVGDEDLFGKLFLFVNCTHASLAGGHLDLVNPERVVLEIPAVEHASSQDIEHRLPILAQLRQRGFRLAFGQFVLEPAYALWRPLASFVKLDLSLLANSQLKEVIKAARRSTDAALIAEKVETAEQYDRVSSLGVQLFQGYWFAKPTLVKTRLVSPSQAHIIQLINLVRNQASTDEIEDVLKKDAGLAFNLLRLINSAGFGYAREVTSFRQAVMLLGLKKLFRWAALLLTATKSSADQATIGNMAVVRGRLMELLATEVMTPEDADNAFVVGIFSLLDVMLGVPMAQAVEMLALPPTVMEVLIHQTGPYAPLLDLASACELGDEGRFNAACQALKLTSQQANWAHLQALAWADQMVTQA
ncbi:EAL domain-containing protein [Curvibacter sp. HBC61]|uniref:EAL domain-containing protein n=2 Tax=Curvibacter cyanobacteriorum TaxID=3026422 RepID=A0ABT5MW48_9BURK|nr:HDOD domain-containing protein [Curvibacter sp. HBC61]MDD0836963.1 EAL domain-containing protein [Curvibacter sp. HBC61]